MYKRQIQAYLDKYTGNMVCSKQLYKEALNHAFDEPKQWEIREINEIMKDVYKRQSWNTTTRQEIPTIICT